jgi:hypothetical protein
VFTLEALVKLVAFGPWGRGSYFSDRWNWLDFAVVLLGWISFAPAVVNLSAIRLLRLLRSLTMFPGMRVVLNAILNSIPGLTHVCVLALLLLTVMGMIGTQLWTGVTAGTCVYPTFNSGSELRCSRGGGGGGGEEGGVSRLRVRRG